MIFNKRSFLIPCVAFVTAYLVHFLLTSVTEDVLEYGLFYAAIVLSGWYGGIKAALISTALSVLALFIPINATNFQAPHVLHLFLFIPVAVLMSVLVERLKTNYAKMSAIVESSDDAIIGKTLEGIITNWNKSAERIYGYTETEVIGKNVSILLPEDRADEIPEILNRLRRGERIEHYQTIRKRKDGKLLDISLTVSPIRDMHGQLIGASAIARDITQQKITERMIQAQLQEKSLLLQEIHHRVKNNLQMVSSLLSLQIPPNGNEALKNIILQSQSRILSMALIHEKLYQSPDLAGIDLSHYITDVCNMLYSSYGVEPDKISLNIDFNQPALDINMAVPCGLLLHEILSNSFKHAFPNGNQGKINVSIGLENGSFTMDISDNGIGLPQEFQPETSGKLGIRLIKILVNQLNGKISVTPAPGTRYVISFPYDGTKAWVPELNSPR